jgi:hypothetical protein
VAWKKSYLVVANVTAASDDLLEQLRMRAESDPAHPAEFTLLIPESPLGDEPGMTRARLAEALGKLRDAGLEADGSVTSADPVIAVTEAWDPKRFDEIIVSTLPLGASKWLHAGLPDRIARLTGAPVSHVVSRPAKPPASTVAAPAHEERGIVLGALGVMGGGWHK